MSALPPKADIASLPRYVHFVPLAAVSRSSELSYETKLMRSSRYRPSGITDRLLGLGPNTRTCGGPVLHPHPGVDEYGPAAATHHDAQVGAEPFRQRLPSAGLPDRRHIAATFRPLVSAPMTRMRMSSGFSPTK